MKMKKNVELDAKAPYENKQKPEKSTKTVPYLDELPLGFKMKESFRWLTPEIKSIIPVGKHKVRIKGVVARAGDVSKNGRKYVAEELMKSVSSMINIPIVLNHNSEKIIGNTELAEWEDEELEVVGLIKDKTIGELLKNNDPSIKGLSMDADYIFTRCTECGKPFFNEVAFRDHMRLEHGITEGLTVPHGIKHKQLALVVSPEVPGLESATVSLAETAPNGFLKLAETIIQEKMQFGEPFAGYSDFADCVAQNQDKDNPEAYCGSLQHKAEEVEDQGLSVSLSPDSSLSTPFGEDEEPAEECPEGMIRNPETGLCVAPDQIIAKIDEAYQKYKHVMEIEISGQLKTIQGFCQNLDTRLKALEEKPNLNVKETEDARGRRLGLLEKEVIEIGNQLSHIKGHFKGHQKITEIQHRQELDATLPYVAEKKK